MKHLGTATGTILAESTMTCGTRVSNQLRTKMTTDRAAVTCKRCLKAIETGMADSGVLASYDPKRRAELKANRGE
jgi:ribosomal protein L30E